MAASETIVANLALAKIGSEKISALSDGNKRARLINELFSSMREEVIASHPWNFAIKRATLAQDAMAPAFGYTYRYPLPSDALRIWEVFEGGALTTYAWEVENGFLMTDQPTCQVKYIFNESNPTKWTGQFTTTLAYRIAADIAYNITQSSTLAQAMMDAYRENLALARSADAQEARKAALNDEQWLNSRY